MPRNGSGVYTAPQNSWNPAVNGAGAQPADWMAILQDLVTAMTQSTSADGQTLITGVWNFGNNRITGVGEPVGTGNALRWEQMIKGADIASAGTIDIPVEGSLFEVTGTTTISTINDQFPGRSAALRFSDSLTITNSPGLKTPTGADETTAPGDIIYVLNTEPGVWEVVAWPRLTGYGRLINVQIFDSAGTHTYNSTPGTKCVIVEGVGGGGAGAGTRLTPAGQVSAGSPGSSGAYGKARFDSDFEGVTVTVGAGGTPVVGDHGNPGGTTSFGSLMSLPGGKGGLSYGPTSPPFITSSPGLADAPVGANIIGDRGCAPGSSVAFGAGSAPGALLGADGGASRLGTGGPSNQGSNPGHNATGPGGGGGGTAAPQGWAAMAGGNGAPGKVIVWEYA